MSVVLPQHYTIPDGFALVVHEVDSAELWQSMRAGTTVPDTPWPDDGTACTDVVLLRHGDHGESGDAGLHWDCVLCKTGIPKSIGAGGRGSRSFGHLSRHRGTGKHAKGRQKAAMRLLGTPASVWTWLGLLAAMYLRFLRRATLQAAHLNEPLTGHMGQPPKK